MTKTVILGIMMTITFIAGILATEFVYADHVNSLPSARIAQSLEVLFVDIGLIKTETDKIQMVKTETDKIQMIKDNQYTLFKVRGPSALNTCDAAGGSADTDRVRIRNDASSGNFMVTSIVFLPQGIDSSSDIIRLIGLSVNGQFYVMVSNDVTGSGFVGAFDVMGTERNTGAGNFPTQIVADSNVIGAPNDIELLISCNAGSTSDINFGANSIIVSGWKIPGDNISIIYAEN